MKASPNNNNTRSSSEYELERVHVDRTTPPSAYAPQAFDNRLARVDTEVLPDKAKTEELMPPLTRVPAHSAKGSQEASCHKSYTSTPLRRYKERRQAMKTWREKHRRGLEILKSLDDYEKACAKQAREKEARAKQPRLEGSKMEQIIHTAMEVGATDHEERMQKP